MNYTIPIYTEVFGDVIPLDSVAEAMARKAATNFGNRRLHGPTLNNIRPRYQSMLVKESRDGRLEVCNQFGHKANVDELVKNDHSGLPSDPSLEIYAIHVRFLHLLQWGKGNGDAFYLLDVKAPIVEFGPTMPDGTKAFRRYVGSAFEAFGELGYFDLQSTEATTSTPDHQAAAEMPDVGSDLQIDSTSSARTEAARTMRGVKREILEHWDGIKSVYGQDADVAQVNRYLSRKRDSSASSPQRKTISNGLSELRRLRLIP